MATDTPPRKSAFSSLTEINRAKMTAKEWEDAQTNVAIGVTIPILLASIVIIGFSPAVGLVCMVTAFTALAIFFAFNG